MPQYKHKNPIYSYINHEKGVVHIRSSLIRDIKQKYSRFFNSHYYFISLNLSGALDEQLQTKVDSAFDGEIIDSLKPSSAHLSIYELWDKTQGPIHLTILFNESPSHQEQRCKAHFYFSPKEIQGSLECERVGAKVFHEPVSDKHLNNYKQGPAISWDKMPQQIKDYVEGINKELNALVQYQHQMIEELYTDTDQRIDDFTRNGLQNRVKDDIEKFSQDIDEKVETIINLSVNEKLRSNALKMSYCFKRVIENHAPKEQEHAKKLGKSTQFSALIQSDSSDTLSDGVHHDESIGTNALQSIINQCVENRILKADSNDVKKDEERVQETPQAISEEPRGDEVSVSLSSDHTESDYSVLPTNVSGSDSLSGKTTPLSFSQEELTDAHEKCLTPDCSLSSGNSISQSAEGSADRLGAGDKRKSCSNKKKKQQKKKQK